MPPAKAKVKRPIRRSLQQADKHGHAILPLSMAPNQGRGSTTTRPLLSNPKKTIKFKTEPADCSNSLRAKRPSYPQMAGRMKGQGYMTLAFGFAEIWLGHIESIPCLAFHDAT